MLVEVYSHLLEEKIMKNLTKLEIFGKITHEESGTDSHDGCVLTHKRMKTSQKPSLGV